MQYEIGFVQFYDGSAKEIVAPFASIKEASAEAARRNKELGVTQTGYGQWGWMTARLNEIPRAEGCLLTEPRGA